MNADLFENRKYTVIILFSAVVLIIIARLFYLQIIDEKLKDSATQNSTRVSTIYPARGIIYDRNHKLIVSNKASYDLMVNKKELQPFDTTEICNLLHVDKEYIDKQFSKKQNNPFILVPLVSPEEFARLQERLYRYPGFFVQRRTIRSYKYNLAAHILGYQGEADVKDIEKDSYYTLGDYIGKSGLEKSYEKHLRGIKGEKHEIVDALGRTHGAANNGKDDIPAQNGADLQLTIDMDLQAYVESLLQNKRGSVVAINPQTGGILAMASAPTYNPATLEGRNRSREFQILNMNPNKPQTNRAINGLYSPGSTFKMANGLIALQMGAIVPETRFSCQGTATKPIRCTHSHGSSSDLAEGVENSCNPYFWNTFKSILNYGKGTTIKTQFALWGEYMKGFGFGVTPEIDIPYAKSGSIPTVEFYDKMYGGSWNALTIRSLAIGQGEVLVSALQLANYMAIIANRGFYFPPHLVMRDNAIGQGDIPWQKKQTRIESKNFTAIIKGMEMVYSGEHGTARYYQNRDITMAGKTGTVENSHGKDHSIFVAFAPVENPKIAICVVIENAGFGSTWAAPVATLTMEKYLTDSIPNYHRQYEQRIMTANLLGD